MAQESLHSRLRGRLRGEKNWQVRLLAVGTRASATAFSDVAVWLRLAGQRPSAERLKSTLRSLAVTPCGRMTKGVE